MSSMSLEMQYIHGNLHKKYYTYLVKRLSKVIPKRFQNCKFVLLNIENGWYRGVFKRGRIGTTRKKTRIIVENERISTVPKIS